jgi:glycerol-3-phosphate dehydrogenase
VNETFPTVNLDLTDIESSWAGLRPLIHEDGKSASELSRKDEIFISDSDLISIAGGKLTGYRKMAERVVDLVIKRKFSKLNLKGCHTHQVHFTGSDFKSDKEVNDYTNQLAGQLNPFGMESLAKYLVANYGRQCDAILTRLKEKGEPVNELAMIKAELWFCLHHEMVVYPLDFFVRRTGMLFFDISRMKSFLLPVLEECGHYYNWSSEQLSMEKNNIEKAIAEASLSTNQQLPTENPS